MKGKQFIKLAVCVAVLLSLVLATVLVACAPQQQTPGSTTTVTPQVPTQTTGPTTTVKPTVTTAPTTTPTKPPAAEVITWKFQTHEGPDLINSTMLPEWFAPALEKMSDGRFQMEIFYSGQLVPNEELVDAAVAGVVDAFDISEGYFKGVMPWTYSAGAEPFMEKNSNEIFHWTYDWEDGKVEDWIEEQWNAHDIHFLGHVPANGVSVIGTKKFDSLEEASDLIVRTHSGSAVWWEHLGARTIYVPGPEIYTALQLGTADFASWKQAASFRDWHWDEVAKYIVQPAYLPWAAHQAYSSLSSWNALPADIQEMITVAHREFAQQHHRKYQVADTTALKEMQEEQGVEIIWINDTDTDRRLAAEATQAVLDFIESQGPASAEWVGFMREYNKYMGYTE